MPLKITRRPERHPPKPDDANGLKTSFNPEKHARDLSEHMRKDADRQYRDNQEVTRAVADKRDEVTFDSLGTGVEVKVQHGMDFVPTRYQKVAGKGSVEPSRDTLADETFVYFECSAEKGKSVTVMLWTREDDNG